MMIRGRMVLGTVCGALALCAGIACAARPAPVVAPSEQQQARKGAEFVGVLAADDPRRALVGEWEYVLTRARPCADLSIRDCEGAARLDAVPEVKGRIRVSDSLFTIFPVRNGLGHSGLPAFARALGSAVSCTEPDWRLLRVDVNSKKLDVHFTPWGADCGVAAYLEAKDGGLRGTWLEFGFAGPRAGGRITMTRVAADAGAVDSASAVRLAMEEWIRHECRGSGGCSLTEAHYRVTGFARERTRYLVYVAPNAEQRLGGGAMIEVLKTGKATVARVYQ